MLTKKTYKKLLFFGFRQSHQGTLINPRKNLKGLRYEEEFFDSPSKERASSTIFNLADLKVASYDTDIETIGEQTDAEYVSYNESSDDEDRDFSPHALKSGQRRSANIWPR